MNQAKGFFIMFLLGTCAQIPILLLIYLLVLGSTAKQSEINVYGRETNAFLADYVMPLEEVDYQAYLKCKSLENNTIFKNARIGEVKYYVVTNPDALLTQPKSRILQVYAAWTVLEAWPGLGRTNTKGKIYFWSWTIKHERFNEAVAHELGHVVGSTADELVAKKIAAQILSAMPANKQ